MSQSGTERAEHIHIIIISAQEADNVITNQVQLFVYTLGRMVNGVIKTAANIRIYHPHVFRVSSGSNPSYYPEYDWERI